MNFLKLTDENDNDCIVNIDRIITVVVEEGGTHAKVFVNDDDYLLVKQNPGQIWNLILQYK